MVPWFSRVVMRRPRSPQEVPAALGEHLMINQLFSAAAKDSLLCSPKAKAQAADGAPAETPARKGPGTARAPSTLKNSEDVASTGSSGPRGIIPVGQEPTRLYDLEEDGGAQKGRQVSPRRAAGGTTTDPDQCRNDKDINNITPSTIRNPRGFYRYKNALKEKRVFVMETLRSLRRAESHVWFAIHNCQDVNGARISQTRIMEITGIKSRKNVSVAVRSLQARGLLEVRVRGKYRPNGNGNHGLASIYCVYPRPEQRIIEAAEQKKESRATKKPVKKKPR